MPESSNYKRTIVTAALLYANGPVHIGHLAGCYLPADIFVRYKRLRNEEILFVSGSDEHGVPITIRAEKEGITPQEVVDKFHHQIKDSFKEFGISFDIYARTSNPIHYETAQDFFLKLYNKGEFLELESEQFYDPEVNRFLADRYIMGTCPVCGNENAYGDQCERCGSTLSPDELINPRSKLSNAQPIKKTTKHWYLPLDKYQKDWLEAWIISKKDIWKSNVYGQCKSWLDQGLQARAMTRDLDWGIPIPLDIPEVEGKKLYVWFDAPIGYISGTKEICLERGLDWKSYWQDEESRLLHFIGKDNIVFHCLIFPSMLKAYDGFILPDNVPANEFMNLEGEKISTSRNWAIWLHEYLIDFPNQQDVLRYALCSNMPENKDNDFTWKDFQQKNNSELVNNLGNFFNRVIVLTQQNYLSITPEVFPFTNEDKELIENIQSFPNKIAEAIEKFSFREALGLVMEFSSVGNKYLQDQAPWKLAKEKTIEGQERLATVLNLSIQVAANLAILLSPFLPYTAAKMTKVLKLDNLQWSQAGKIDLIPSSQPLQSEGLLFEKIDDAVIEKQLEKLKQSTLEKNNESEEVKAPLGAPKSEITYEDFSKMDIRVATIIAAEKVKKADKLLKLTLNTGLDTRTVVSGIAEHFSPEEIIGQQVCLLANLAPRNLKGIESQGMILMAKDATGKLVFVKPDVVTQNGSAIS
jgi:methionyl-tRNA synthetase